VVGGRRERAAAMLVAPAQRCGLMARFRGVAITCGPDLGQVLGEATVIASACPDAAIAWSMLGLAR
jgi:hypothetical protein